MFYLFKKLVKEYAKKRRVAKKLGDNYIVYDEIKVKGFNMKYVVSRHDKYLRAFIDEEDVVIPFTRHLNFHYYKYFIIGDIIYVALNQTIYSKHLKDGKLTPIAGIDDLNDFRMIINDSVVYYVDMDTQHVAYDMITGEKLKNVERVSTNPLIFEKAVNDKYEYVFKRRGKSQASSYYTSSIFCYNFDTRFFLYGLYQINQIFGDSYRLYQYDGNNISSVQDFKWDMVKPTKIAQYFNYIAAKDGETFLLKVDEEFNAQEIPGTAIELLDSKKKEYKNYYKIYDKDRVHLAFFSEKAKRLYIIATYEGVDIKISNKSRFNEAEGQFERKLLIVKEEDAISIKTNNE